MPTCDPKAGERETNIYAFQSQAFLHVSLSIHSRRRTDCLSIVVPECYPFSYPVIYVTINITQISEQGE